MTNQQPNSQQWQINLPLAKFPKSKFQFGDRVAIHGQDDLGNHYCEVGEIIGMEYVAESDSEALLQSRSSPTMVLSPPLPKMRPSSNTSRFLQLRLRTRILFSCGSSTTLKTINLALPTRIIVGRASCPSLLNT